MTSNQSHVARSAAALLAGATLLAGCGSPEVAPPSPGKQTSAPAAGPAWFDEAATERGLDFVHDSGYVPGRYLFPEIMAGGAALFDMDGDGDLDAYFVQAGSVEQPVSDAGRNRLYENVGGGRFEDRTAGSGADDPHYGFGVAAGDYDNDGDLDLYVTNYGGPNVLLRNDGGGRFSDVTDAAGVGDPAWGTSTVFFDYDRDGWLDLFIANYVNWSPSIEQDCYNRSGVLDFCLPTNYNAPAADKLYHNQGDGTFRDVSVEMGLLAAFGNGLGVVAADFDGDEWPDLFVANDTMMNQLWLNERGGGFVDESLLRGCALDEHGMTKAGMGIVAEDFDDDGDQDVIVVNLHGQTDSFFRNENGFFVDHTGNVGLSTTSRRYTRFGIGLVDFDNDGHVDLFQANGRVILAPESTEGDPFAEVNVLHRGTAAGRFTEVVPRGGTVDELVATSRAAVFGDIDGDGGVDVLVVNRDAPVHLLMNVVPDRGNWIRFRVVDEHGRDAYGAHVSVGLGSRTIHREVRSTFSYCAANDPRVHVGLAEAGGVDAVTVRWVDGMTESFGAFDGGRVVELRRGTGQSSISRAR